jgi:hypothetical protein
VASARLAEARELLRESRDAPGLQPAYVVYLNDDDLADLSYDEAISVMDEQHALVRSCADASRVCALSLHARLAVGASAATLRLHRFDLFDDRVGGDNARVDILISKLLQPSPPMP